jgi:restriction system protein
MDRQSRRQAGHRQIPWSYSGRVRSRVFLTTSRFSKDAKEASYKKGAITILLLDGPAIVDLLVERGLGVRRLPLYLLDIDEEFFELQDE